MKDFNKLTDAEKIKIFNNAMKDPEIRNAIESRFDKIPKKPKETEKTDSVYCECKVLRAVYFTKNDITGLFDYGPYCSICDHIINDPILNKL